MNRSRSSLDGLTRSFSSHGPDVDHGFALAPGLVHNRYDEDADRRSTMSMISLFAEVSQDCFKLSNAWISNYLTSFFRSGLSLCRT